jgi:hypothetical protein
MSNNSNLNDLFNNNNNMKNVGKTNVGKTNVGKTNGKKKSSKLFMILILVLVLYLFYRLYRNVVKNVKSYTPIVPSIRQGTDSKTPIDGNKFASPSDGQYGTEFTYIGWLFINGTNFSDSSGCAAGSANKKRWVFVKGSNDYLANNGEVNYPLLQAPGVWIYPDDNKLEINMNTYASTVETCDIGNIPIGKWFHISIMLIGNSMDIYINAQLKKRCKFKGVPKLNYGDLYLTAQGGFDGYISKLKYYNRSLQPYEIEQAFYAGPSNELPSGTVSDKPPYLASDYWMKTGFPNSTP